MTGRHEQSLAEPIAADECRELLQRKAKVGRVGFLADGRPMVLPVNYLAEGDSVVFCTSDGTSLSLLGGTGVAFEADGFDSLRHSGWSVLVHGTAQEITDAQELTRLRRSPLQTWGRRDVEEGDHWIRIPIEEISGRRIPDVYSS